MLAWLGIALLSASWLFGLEYYHQPDPTIWALLLATGTLLLATLTGRLPPRRQAAAALLLVLPAAICWPLPQQASVLLLAAGLMLYLLPLERCWPARSGAATGSYSFSRLPIPAAVTRLATGSVLAGGVLCAQALAIEVYNMFTSRSHELPAPWPGLLGGIASWLGIDTGVEGSTVAMFSMRENHLLGATWELLLDPVTLSFLIGGMVAWAWRNWADGLAPRPRLRRLGSLAVGAGLLVLWLPLRSGLLMAFYLHSVLRTEYEELPNSVRWFWSGWLHLALLAVPVLLAWRFCTLRPRRTEQPSPVATRGARARSTVAWRRPLAGALACTAAAVMTAAVLWDPLGPRKQGRVLIEEYHPDPEKVWERTDKPFDTHWYGQQSGYTYYCIYDYLGHFYDAQRLTQPIHEGLLQSCDVLVLKTPTRPAYSRAEVESLRRFVKEGGGLLLIGEHTDVFGTSRCLNPVARLFGFQFVPDCLFGVDSVFEERLQPGPAPHPVVQYMRWMDFATSCSLDVRGSSGRAVIRSTGLKNKTADYHVDNFYPLPSDTAKMRYGAFVQLWSTHYGRGRVLAFTDSTIFSNFCTFEPGKAELMMGMIEWLNHRPPAINPRPWLAILAVLLAAGGLGSAWGRSDAWLVMLAAALLGYTAAVLAVAAAHRAAMPYPEPKRRVVRVVMDRSISEAQLPSNGFISGRSDGFGIFERWALRLGYFTARREAPETFADDVDVLVVAYPTKPVSSSYRRQLENYVREGGKLLVLDSARNTESTANDLLDPFQMSVDRSTDYQGDLQSGQGLAPVSAGSAVEVRGGQPFVWLQGRPVGAWRDFGAGTVTVVGYGDRFCDEHMGVTGDIVPDDELQRAYDFEYSLLRAMVENKSLGEQNPRTEPDKPTAE